MSLLEVEDLRVWYRSRSGEETQVIRGIDIVLEPGDRLGLVGESGCGKSTTVMALLGLLPSNATVSGRIKFHGIDLLAGGERAFRARSWTDIAMVFQGSMNTFNPVRRVNVQIADAIRVRGGAPRREALERANRLLGSVGIPSSRMSSFPHEFSGGMRQRAAIALALSCDPVLLIADEPTTALDVIVQARIMDLLTSLCDERDLALILVSHDLALVLEACSQVDVMYGGLIVESCDARQFHLSAQHPYSKLLLRSTSQASGITGGQVSPDGMLPTLADSGCGYLPRCDLAVDKCATDRPALEALGSRQAVACHVVSRLAKPHAQR
jgi:peptide/nickel transport system ATP-binding protein